MKAKHWGLILLALVMAVAGVYTWLEGRQLQQTDIPGAHGLVQPCVHRLE